MVDVFGVIVAELDGVEDMDVDASEVSAARDAASDAAKMKDAPRREFWIEVFIPAYRSAIWPKVPDGQNAQA